MKCGNEKLVHLPPDILGQVRAEDLSALVNLAGYYIPYRLQDSSTHKRSIAALQRIIETMKEQQDGSVLPCRFHLGRGRQPMLRTDVER
jgi:hypothetical protein